MDKPELVSTEDILYNFITKIIHECKIALALLETKQLCNTALMRKKPGRPKGVKNKRRKSK